MTTSTRRNQPSNLGMSSGIGSLWNISDH